MKHLFNVYYDTNKEFLYFILEVGSLNSKYNYYKGNLNIHVQKLMDQTEVFQLNITLLYMFLNNKICLNHLCRNNRSLKN
jgi:hypothetical protein